MNPLASLYIEGNQQFFTGKMLNYISQFHALLLNRLPPSYGGRLHVHKSSRKKKEEPWQVVDDVLRWAL